MVDIPTVPLTENDDEDRFGVIRLNSLAAHHALILNKLQGVEDGTVPNLMLLLPPGSAKSTYADVVFVPWFMARRPRRNVILASYASDIAKKQGRRARQLIKSRSFLSLMDVDLRTDQAAADEWALSNGSEYMAGGLLSGLTGNRGALGLLDDPIKGREAAESQGIRDKTWDAYIDDFCSRLIPRAPQVMILTRWHQDDPAGRILPETWAGESGVFNGRDGRVWHVICLPAIADRNDDPLGRSIGETLWPEWFSLEHWEPFKRNPRTWFSLYQQKPSPEEGTYFQKDWFDGQDRRWRAGELPRVHRYMTSDHAVTEGGGDFAVIRVWGVDTRGHLYMVDGWRGQATMDVTADEAIRLIKEHKPFAWFPEDDNNWKSAAPFIRRRMREKGATCRIDPLSPHGSDKPTKARGFQAMAVEGRVHLPATPEGDEILAEYLRFPAGKHDDEVDAASLIGRAIDQAHPAILKTPPPKPDEPADRYARARQTAGGGDDFYG